MKPYYSEEQIDEAIDRKADLLRLRSDLSAWADRAEELGIVCMSDVLENAFDDIQMELDALEDVIHYGYQKQFDEQMLGYYAAVI